MTRVGPEPTAVGEDLVTALYLAHYGALVRLAALLLDEPAACEDVVQEAYVRVWARPRQFRDPTSVLAYLRKTVLNQARSTLRRRLVASRRPPASPTSAAAADVDAIRAFASQAAVRAIGELPRRQREVVVLRYYAGLSEAETADTLGISAGSVKGYASRGLAALAEQMEQWR